jgi:hypothetical protein
MYKHTMRRGFAVVFLLILVAIAVNTAAVAQPRRERESRDIERVQAAVRDQIIRSEGSNVEIRFNNDAQTRFVSNTDTRVNGTGSVVQFGRGNRRRDFTYEASMNYQNGNLSRTRYRWSGGWGQPDTTTPGGGPGGPGWLGGLGGRGGPGGRAEFRGPIINRETGKGLGVAGGSTYDGANVVQWTFTGEPNQRWRVTELRSGEYAIVNEGSGKVLDVVDNALRENGANVQQYQWHGRENQRWRIEPTGQGYYRIISVASGKCLDVFEKSNRDGANIHQWDCHGDRNQEWQLQR